MKLTAPSGSFSRRIVFQAGIGFGLAASVAAWSQTPASPSPWSCNLVFLASIQESQAVTGAFSLRGPGVFLCARPGGVSRSSAVTVDLGDASAPGSNRQDSATVVEGSVAGIQVSGDPDTALIDQYLVTRSAAAPAASPPSPAMESVQASVIKTFTLHGSRNGMSLRLSLKPTGASGAIGEFKLMRLMPGDGGGDDNQGQCRGDDCNPQPGASPSPNPTQTPCPSVSPSASPEPGTSPSPSPSPCPSQSYPQPGTSPWPKPSGNPTQQG